MRTPRNIFYGIGLCSMLMGVSLRAQSPDVRSATIQYPAQDNFQLDEGTLEIYVTAGFGTDKTGATNSFPLMELSSPLTQERILILYLPSAQRFVLIGYLKPIQQSWVISKKEGVEGHRWEPGTRHVIAVTWKGKFRQFFVDGEPGEETEVEGPFTLDLARSVIRVGSATNALWTIDEFRISSIRRTPEELKEGVNKAPDADAYTLLLDHYDGDSPAVSRGNVAHHSRQVEGNSQAIEGKFGNALKLWSGTEP